MTQRHFHPKRDMIPPPEWMGGSIFRCGVETGRTSGQSTGVPSRPQG
ncbi:hypothetical protein AAGC89_04455 [Proteus mirabilis]